MDDPEEPGMPVLIQSIVKDLEVVFQNYSQVLSKFSGNKHRHHNHHKHENHDDQRNDLGVYATAKPTHDVAEYFTVKPTLFFQGDGGSGNGESVSSSSVSSGVIGSSSSSSGSNSFSSSSNNIVSSAEIADLDLKILKDPSSTEHHLDYPELLNITSNDDLFRLMNGSYGNETWGPRYSVPKISAEIQIAMYTLIFLTAVIGNLAVIVTLIQNKRMRTVTNVFLLNLALSDMLLAMFCMPFTLVPVLLRNFIFGAVMCVLIRYLQAVSVGASCFTLVAISLERYFAICRPLHSRSWQTLSHAYRCIIVCWILSAILMLPVAVFQKHHQLSNDAHACREEWPDLEWEKAYTVLLDLALLVMPVLLMSLAYTSVVHALMYDVRGSSFKAEAPEANGNGEPLGKAPKGMLANYRTIELRLLSRDSMRSITSVSSTEETCLSRSGTLVSHTGGPTIGPRGQVLSRGGTMTDLLAERCGGGGKAGNGNACKDSPAANRRRSNRPQQQPSQTGRQQHHRIRHNNPRKIRENKIRVIRMLFVVVLEFFLCWTPVYIIQTWMIFDFETAYEFVTPLTKTLIHLLSYVSSCCNPITYCFMNKKFREGFVRVFTCRKPPPPLKERREQLQMMLQDSRRCERFNSMASVTSVHASAQHASSKAHMMLRANSCRQFDFANNINPIEEGSHEDQVSQS